MSSGALARGTGAFMRRGPRSHAVSTHSWREEGHGLSPGAGWNLSLGSPSLRDSEDLVSVVEATCLWDFAVVARAD